MEGFAKECMKKFKQVAKDKKRTLTPWKEHTFVWLLSRLQEELEELDREVFNYAAGENNLKKIISECFDVALFAWFIFMKAVLLLKKDKNY